MRVSKLTANGSPGARPLVGSVNRTRTLIAFAVARSAAAVVSSNGIQVMPQLLCPPGLVSLRMSALLQVAPGDEVV